MVNEHIRELGDRVHATPLVFLCECGCLTTRVDPALVSLTATAYDDLDGAPVLAVGHRRPVAAAR
jgi:hypothetical protein